MTQDEGWRYNHKTNSYFNVNWIDEDARIKEVQIAQHEDLKKQLNSTSGLDLSPAEVHNLEKSVAYFKEFKDVQIPEKLDLDKPEDVIQFSNKLAKAYAGSNADVACYHTAGIVSAVFNKAKEPYHCYAGTCYPTKEKMSAYEGMCNHVWVVHKGKIYETYPQQNDKVSQYYHKPLIEVSFKGLEGK